jgi:fumarate hydratase, class II
MITDEPSSDFRTEHDSLGEVRVPKRRYWGAQTERSRLNFPIGREPMPKELIYALALVKKACAQANLACGVLPADKARAIEEVCDEIVEGELDSEFPLPVWQTGSGTHTNMNLNEVISNRAHVRAGGSLTDTRRSLHPNDDVNRSQSSNDVFPTAMNVAAHRLIAHHTLVKLRVLRDALAEKAEEFMPIVKVGRTHLMDATPLRLGQEFSGYVAQLDQRLSALESANRRLASVALGGTAVGTGLNAPAGFGAAVAARLATDMGLPLSEAPDHFAAQGARDELVGLSGDLRVLAAALLKIANDLRWMASGPRTGLAEIRLPDLQPGSSIMPGKVNPVIPEAVSQVVVQVYGNDAAIAFAGSQGNFELNVFLPVIARNLLESIRLLASVSRLLADGCVAGLEADVERCRSYAEATPQAATALNPLLGYERVAALVKESATTGRSIRDLVVEQGLVPEAEIDAVLDLRKLTRGG